MSATTIAGILSLVSTLLPIIIQLLGGGTAAVTAPAAMLPFVGASTAVGLYKAADAKKVENIEKVVDPTGVKNL